MPTASPDQRRKVQNGSLDLAYYEHKRPSRAREENSETATKDLSDGKLHMIPPDVFKKFKMKRDTGFGLQQLWLDNQALASLPHKIGSLLSLRTLSLANNNIQTLPDAVCDLPRLECLNLSGNQFVNLPQNAEKLTTLRELYMNRNRLKEIPNVLSSMRRLQKLSLSDNQIAHLPEFLTKLRQLIDFDISSNYLSGGSVKNFPWKEMSKELQTINFRGNNEVVEMPPGLLRLKQLQFVALARTSFDLSSLQ